jgi:hypothetical protein
MRLVKRTMAVDSFMLMAVLLEMSKSTGSDEAGEREGVQTGVWE